MLLKELIRRRSIGAKEFPYTSPDMAVESSTLTDDGRKVVWRTSWSGLGNSSTMCWPVACIPAAVSIILTRVSAKLKIFPCSSGFLKFKQLDEEFSLIYHRILTGESPRRVSVTSLIFLVYLGQLDSSL